VNDAGPIRGVSDTGSVYGKLQVEGDDLAKQQVCICLSLFLPSLPYSRPVYRFAARSDSWVTNKGKVCPVQKSARNSDRCLLLPHSVLTVLSLSVE
jgi:hypothetical protein